MSLREKYAYAIQTAKGVRMQGAAEERDGKLHFHGFVSSQDDANQIWNAIKTIPEWQTEIVADIRATTSAPVSDKTADSQTTYTVKPGDTLSKIAKQHLGDATAYMEIFNANRDQLKDPDRIQPGQVLKIPHPAKS